MARFRKALQVLFRKPADADDAPDRTMERNERIFKNIERSVKEKALYLNPRLNVDDLADAVCSNRTYVTSALNSHGFTFPAYICSFRVQKVLILLSDPAVEDKDACGIADLCGFRSDRAMTYHLMKAFGVPFSTLRDRAASMRQVAE